MTPVKRPAAKKATAEDRDLIRIAAFILLDAAVFHDALAGVNPAVSPLGRATSPLQAHLEKAWAQILKIDYTPVFEIAREVLLSFPSSPNTEAMLKDIIDIARSVGASGVLGRHDFMGRVYHKLLLRTTGRYYATYYTSIPAAWLLANLVFKSPHADWDFSSPEAISKFRVIDPACGSGTLLSASYMALKDLHLLSTTEAPDVDELHRVLVEDVLHGWDVLDYAAHLTLTTLALHANTSVVGRSNVYTLPVGLIKGIAHLGSLDYLKHQTTLLGHGFGGLTTRQSLEGTREEQTIEPPDCDVVIMNPPFSRSAKPNVKFGYTDPNEKKSLNAELARVTRELGRAGIGQAGLGAHFMLLALEAAKPEGRIGIVIPRSMLSGVAWTQVRADYLRDCEIEYIVSNFDPGDASSGIEPWNWSENTDLGEVLIVARKTRQPLAERTVTYVNLWQKPANEIAALLISHQAIASRKAAESKLDKGQWQSLALGNTAVGSAYDVDQSRLKQNWLIPCVFAHPQLNELVLRLFFGTWPAARLRDLTVSLGRDIKQVKDHFAQSTIPTAFPMVWGHQGSMNTLALSPAYVGYGQPTRGDKSTSLHASASRLLLAERPHPSTECLFATRVAQPVLTTAFWEIELHNSEWEPAFLLWCNSTYGILVYLAFATSSMGDIFKAKKEQIAEMRMVDPSRIDLAECERLYEQVKDEPLYTVAAEFRRAASGQGVRFALDSFWAEVAGLPAIRPQQYELLAVDPVLTKRRM